MSHGSRFSRGAVSALGIAAIVSLAVSGCSSPATPAPAESAKAGGSLVVGVTSDPDTLFPWKATQFQAVNVLQNIYGTLTEFDQDLNVVPGLAESWDASDDGLTVTLTLRDGVTFDDGSAVRLRRRQVLARPRSRTRPPPRSPRSAARLRRRRRRPRPEHRRAHPVGAGRRAARRPRVVNMAMLSSDDTEEALEHHAQRHRPLRVRRPHAERSRSPSPRTPTTGATQPTLDSVEFRVIPDESSIVSALQSGNVQLAVLNDPLVAQTAEGGGDHRRQDAAAQLPRAPAERPRGDLDRRQRAPRHPVRHRPPAGARHGRARRGRGHRPDHVAGLPAPTPTPGPARRATSTRPPTTWPRPASPTASRSRPSCRRASTPRRSTRRRTSRPSWPRPTSPSTSRSSSPAPTSTAGSPPTSTPRSPSTAAAPTPTACTAATSPAPATSTRSPATARPSSTQLFAQGKATSDPAERARRSTRRSPTTSRTTRCGSGCSPATPTPPRRRT